MIEKKKMFSIRLRPSLIEALKERAAKNKSNFTYPDNYNSMIEDAIVKYLGIGGKKEN